MLLADVDDGGRLDLFCAGKSSFPQIVHDTISYPNEFLDVTGIVPFTSNTQDSVIADLDGDLRPDIVHVRGGKRLSGATQVGTDAIDAQLVGTDPSHFTFEASGAIDVVVSIERSSSVFTGRFDPATGSSWTVSGAGDAVEFDYDSGSQTWTVVLDNSGWALASIQIFATTPISNLQNVWSLAIHTPKTPSFQRNLLNGWSEDLQARRTQRVDFLYQRSGGRFRQRYGPGLVFCVPGSGKEYRESALPEQRQRPVHTGSCCGRCRRCVGVCDN